ncbi:MAG: hypothetical protein JNM79_21455 [Burkholderiales bacterium]|nr:hypothetical protein [Burkholderiales bacterium]
MSTQATTGARAATRRMPLLNVFRDAWQYAGTSEGARRLAAKSGASPAFLAVLATATPGPASFRQIAAALPHVAPDDLELWLSAMCEMGLLATVDDAPVDEALEPPAAVAAESSAKAAFEPSAKAAAEPSTKAAAEPSAKAAAEPPLKVVVEPTAKVAAESSAKAVVEPSLQVVFEPPAKVVVEPPVEVKPAQPGRGRPVVLLVDADQDARAAWRGALDGMAVEILESARLEEVEDLIRARKPAWVVLGMRGEDFEGIHLLKALKRPRAPRVCKVCFVVPPGHLPTIEDHDSAKRADALAATAEDVGRVVAREPGEAVVEMRQTKRLRPVLELRLVD